MGSCYYYEVILMRDMMTIRVMIKIYWKGSVDVNEVFMMTAHDSRGVLDPPDPKSDDGTRESTQEGVASWYNSMSSRPIWCRANDTQRRKFMGGWAVFNTSESLGDMHLIWRSRWVKHRKRSGRGRTPSDVWGQAPTAAGGPLQRMKMSKMQLQGKSSFVLFEVFT